MQGSSSNVATVNFFTKFTSSEQFEKVFREGMSLVEETANYLDGPGRLDARVSNATAPLPTTPKAAAHHPPHAACLMAALQRAIGAAN